MKNYNAKMGLKVEENENWFKEIEKKIYIYINSNVLEEKGMIQTVNENRQYLRMVVVWLMSDLLTAVMKQILWHMDGLFFPHPLCFCY